MNNTGVTDTQLLHSVYKVTLNTCCHLMFASSTCEVVECLEFGIKDKFVYESLQFEPYLCNNVTEVEEEV